MYGSWAISWQDFGAQYPPPESYRASPWPERHPDVTLVLAALSRGIGANTQPELSPSPGQPSPANVSLGSGQGQTLNLFASNVVRPTS